MKHLLLLVLILLLLVPASAEYSKYLEFDSVRVKTDDKGIRHFFCLKDGYWQLYKPDGTLLVDWLWEDDGVERVASYWFSGFGSRDCAIICTDDLYEGTHALIDRSGNYILEPIYRNIEFLSDDILLVRKEHSYGLVDTQGNTIVPMECRYISDFTDGVAIFFAESGCGILDTGGRIVLDPIYSDVTRTDDGSYLATLGNEETYFALQEGELIPLATVGTSLNLEDYYPHTGSKTPRLEQDSLLTLTENLPRLDGATALFPMYSGVAEMVYPEDIRYQKTTDEITDPLVTLSNTLGAYQRLIDGDCDLIFVARPSKAQLEAAKAAGIEFDPTVIAKEAFVFFVNKDNPLDNITTEQIRSIYSGKLNSWNDLGIPDLGKIVAYQRPENSGSQTALQNLMGDMELMEPPTESIMVGMSDIINVVEYRNYPNAIGYSFRFFLSEMMGSDVKLLAVDGVEPTAENIRSGAYPIISDIYAVRRKGDSNHNLQKLIDWLLSEQGQALIERSGYVPVR